MEALSYGIPLVAFNVGGLGEVVNDRENGLLCPSGDVEALSQAVLELKNNAQLRGKFALNAKKAAQTKFNLHKMRERYLAILRTSI